MGRFVKGQPRLPNAGRKPGSKNKATRLAEAAAAAALDRARAENSDLEPLDFMLAVVRDPAVDPRTRLEAAKAAAQYRHARLNSVEHKGNAGIHVTISGDDADLL